MHAGVPTKKATRKPAATAKQNKPPAKKKSTPKPNHNRELIYSIRDVRALLDLLEETPPIGSTEWASIASVYNEALPENTRDKESLKRKLNKVQMQQQMQAAAEDSEERREANHQQMRAAAEQRKEHREANQRQSEMMPMLLALLTAMNGAARSTHNFL